jgi:GT2 family glycosyltransferase
MPVGWRIGHEYEVIVYDDASTDGTTALLEQYGDRLRVMRGDGKGWYAINNNRMAKQAKGKWLCMLNNDTVLRSAWIGPMIALAEKHPDAGVVGNTHVFPGWEIVNHAGVVFDHKQIPRNLYDGLHIKTRGVRQNREVQAAMAACWITPRDFYQELGGFDEQFITGCEDIDYCMRVREHGRKVYISALSVIVHLGGSTPGRYDFDTQNERLFLKRWKSKVQSDWRQLPESEGVDWPRRSDRYTLVRTLWRVPIIRRCVAPLLRTPAGARLRQRLARKLIIDQPVTSICATDQTPEIKPAHSSSPTSPVKLVEAPAVPKASALQEFKSWTPLVPIEIMSPPELDFDQPRPGIAPGNLHKPACQWSDPTPREPITHLSDQLDEHPRARELLEAFEIDTYLRINADLLDAGVTKETALEHFAQHGYRQRRIFSQVLHDTIDPLFYRKEYPELQLESDHAAITHYSYIGRFEDRVPNTFTKNELDSTVHLFQMGKVGSKTIEDAVERAGGGECIHLHWADVYHNERPRLGIHYSRILNQQRSHPTNVVVGVRDPFERVVSGFFQEAESLSIKKNMSDKRAALEQLHDRFTRDAWVICNWFDHNFYCGLDIHEHAFDPKLGYSVIEHENIRVFLYRVDVLNQLQQPLSEFLKLPKLTIGKKNTGGDKLYADVYKEVSDQFRVPHEIASKLIESKYAKHFFKDAELSRMVETWSDRQPATR